MFRFFFRWQMWWRSLRLRTTLCAFVCACAFARESGDTRAGFSLLLLRCLALLALVFVFVLEHNFGSFRWTRVTPSAGFSTKERQGVRVQTSRFRISKVDPSECKPERDGLEKVEHGWLLPLSKSFSRARPNPSPPPTRSRSRSHSWTYELAKE